MKHSAPLRLFAVLTLALLLARPMTAGEKPAKPDEAVRVHFLIVADSDAKEGAACKLDADNMKAVLDAGLKKQKLESRYSIDVLTGRDVSPARVLKHYHDLKVGTNDALVFYYSGHGAYHSKKGHLLTFNKGDLSRTTLLAAMQKQKPRLTVVLTDCCAVYDDPPNPKLNPITLKPPMPPPLPKNGLGPVPGLPRGFFADFDQPAPTQGAPPRPMDYVPPNTTGPVELPHPPRPDNYRPPPPVIDLGPDDELIGADGVVLRTADGPLPLKALVAQTDGELLRHLFYRHTGLVDISGCERGKAAYATTRWGGGLFTVALLSLQKDNAARFDTNKNGLAEWSEFFVTMQLQCDRNAAYLTRGKLHQMPEATKLGQPSLQVAAK